VLLKFLYLEQITFRIRRKVELLRKTVSLIMLMVLLVSTQPLVFAVKFNLGDTVEVFNTGASGLIVRDAPAGNAIGKKYDGNRGMILAGPQSASYGGVVYNWWKVRWGDDALEGWSAEGYPGGVDYLRKVSISPSTKFTLGDYVKVYNMGGSSLVVRTDPPALSYKDSEVDGTFGKVEGGPFYGVAEERAGFYHFWKVNFGSVVGWSAEDWLMKATPSDLTVEDIWIDPASFNPGSGVTIYTRIKNIGASAAISDQGLWIKAYFDGGLCYQEGIEGLGAGYAYTFQWSYTWPSDTNWHTIKVEVDPNNYIIESNENNNIRSESFQATAPPPPNQPPTLYNGYVSPSSGDTSTTFGYYVTYSDPEGDVPTTKYVYIDGSPYTMTKISGDYVSGAVFRYSTTLSAGSHNYYFYFEDSVHSHVVRLPTTGTYSGPNVSPPPAPDFSITASPTSFTIQQGSSDTSVITITSMNGFNQPVQLTASGVPSGVTAALNPQQVTPPVNGLTTSTLTVTVDTTATPGSYTLTVTGTNGTLTHNVDIPFVITAAPTEWTFAIITDLHIGRGYSNYNGESYYLTDRLQTVVKWISDNATAYNIKFVVVLGDITEDGTQAEMQKAKEILDGLGEIPYFPIIGNHDVQNGDSNFDSEFDNNFLDTQCGKLNVAWENGRTNEPGVRLQNYAFTYEDKTFVFLDFVDRVWPYAQALRYDSTLAWLQTQLQKGNPSFLFSHHPMIENRWVAFDDIGPIGDTITVAGNNKGTKVLASFAGHIHGYYDSDKLFSADYSFGSKTDAVSHLGELIFSPVFFNANGDYQKEGFATPANIPVITTEALMVGSNEPTEKSVIRLAKITGDKITTSEEGVFPSLNPYILSATTSVHLSGNDVDFQVYAFTKMFNTGHPIEYSLYVDGEFRERKESSAVERVSFKNQKLTHGTHEVNLTVVGYAPDGRRVVESIKRTIIVGKLFVHLKCPADIVVTDPAGRTIGKRVNEIPGATYTEADLDEDGNLDKLVVILAPIDGNYVLTLNGTGLGLYSMIAQFATSQEVVSFNATQIPVSLRAVHQYTVNWTALSQGGKGVTVRVDSNSDDVFEYTFTSDSELNRVEYIAATTKYDLGIIGITTSKTVTGEGYTLPINTTIMNYGVYTETFNITIYANTTLVTSQTVTLTSGNSTTISYTWNTTGFAKGNYTIWAYAWPVVGEEYKADNTLVDGWIVVTIAGDVDGSFLVDGGDLGLLGFAWYSKPGDSHWNPNADINGDGLVDGSDLGILGFNWFKTA
jgi:3',5'-cyclic AMP phosphodiesterase CpdA